VIFSKKTAKVIEFLLETKKIPRNSDFFCLENVKKYGSLVALLEARRCIVAVASNGPQEYTRVIHYKLG
jgi:hypothetical protein